MGFFEIAIPRSDLPAALCAGSLGYKQQCSTIGPNTQSVEYVLPYLKNMLEVITIKDRALPFIVRENAFKIKYSNRFNMSTPGANDPLRRTVILPSVQMQSEYGMHSPMRRPFITVKSLYFPLIIMLVLFLTSILLP